MMDTKNPRLWGGVFSLRRGTAGALASLLALISSACYPCGTAVDTLFVRARLVDAETQLEVQEVSVGGRIFTGGEETEYAPILFAPDAFGMVDLEFVLLSGFCTYLGEQYPPPEELPTPDRLEIIIIRNDCQQTFSIDISEDTVVDMAFPDDVLELKDPILVEPCEE